jgi:hypothetical protein
MMTHRPVLVSLAGLALAGWLAFGAVPAVAGSALKGLDADRDATIDLSEAKQAAEKLFDTLDRNHDGTLDARELRGRIKKGEFAGADPDKDATLTKDEYLDMAEQRFHAADTNDDGTLDARELHSKAGKDLLKLLK